MPKQRFSTKGVPDNLVPLARKGLRIRFNGGWLGESEQDRLIADWLDETPAAWSILKFILFQYLTGRSAAPVSQDEYRNEITESEMTLANFED